MFEIIKNNKIDNSIETLFNSFFYDDYCSYNQISSLDAYYGSDDKHYFIELAIPGVNKKDINLSISEGYIYINYESANTNKKTIWNHSFNRRIKLPSDVVESKIDAELRDGILTINIQKDQLVSKKRNIEIK